MDRILTKRERHMASRKSVYIATAVVFGLIAISVFGTNHDQVIGVFVKAKHTVCHIIDAVSVFFESLKLA
ncbi:MAG: hypothetical protein FJY80_07120 [Candidatus Aminicenantes bacterium]|nr:hypothetical protein [Candidatus Aminicenantes bacterium]